MDSNSRFDVTDSDNDMPAAPQPGQSFEPTETPPPSMTSDTPSSGVDADVETSPETTFDQPAAPEPPANAEVESHMVESDPSPLDKDEFGSIDAAMAERESATSDFGASSDTTSPETPDVSNAADVADSGDTIPVTVGSSQDSMSGPEMPETPEVGGMDTADEPLNTSDAMSAAVPAAAAMPSESFPSAAPASSPEASPVNVTVEQAAAPAAKPQSTPDWFAGAPAATNQPTMPMQPTMQPDQMMPPQGMPPVIPHQGKKSSKKALLIAIILVLLAAGGAAAYFLVGPGKSDSSNTAQTTEQPSEAEAPAEDTPAETVTPEAITATYLSEFDAVCEGKTISNAASFTTNQTAVITTFANNPRNVERWSSEIVGSGKSYYLDDVDQFAKVSVVGCAKADESTITDGQKCEYTSSSAGKVTVDYKALKYELTLYEAKTGKKIGESTMIDAPADTCPTVLLYDAETKTAYASPDEDALEAALDAFVK